MVLVKPGRRLTMPPTNDRQRNWNQRQSRETRFSEIGFQKPPRPTGLLEITFPELGILFPQNHKKEAANHLIRYTQEAFRKAIIGVGIPKQRYWATNTRTRPVALTRVPKQQVLFKLGFVACGRASRPTGDTGAHLQPARQKAKPHGKEPAPSPP